IERLRRKWGPGDRVGRHADGLHNGGPRAGRRNRNETVYRKTRGRRTLLVGTTDGQQVRRVCGQARAVEAGLDNSAALGRDGSEGGGKARTDRGGGSQLRSVYLNFGCRRRAFIRNRQRDDQGVPR